MAELPVFTIRSDPSLGDIKSIDDVYKLKQGKEGPVDGADSRCREHEYASRAASGNGCLPCRRLRLHKMRPKSEAAAGTDPVQLDREEDPGDLPAPDVPTTEVHRAAFPNGEAQCSPGRRTRQQTARLRASPFLSSGL